MGFFNRLKTYLLGEKETEEARTGLQERVERIREQDRVIRNVYVSLNHIHDKDALDEEYFSRVERFLKESAENFTNRRNPVYSDDAVLERCEVELRKYREKINRENYDIKIDNERLARIKRKIVTLESILYFKKENKDMGVGYMIKKSFGENTASKFYKEHSALRNKAVVNKYGTFHLESLEEFGIVRVKKKERQTADKNI